MREDTRRAVLFSNFSKGWGGGEEWHFAMARGLRGRGWPVELIVHRRSELGRRCEAGRLPCWRMHAGALSLADPWHLYKLYQGILARHPLAVICNSATELKSVGLAARMADTPRIILRRGIQRPLADTVFNRLALQYLATRLITNSHATLAAMETGHPRLVRALWPRVIHNGVDPAGWPRPAPREPGGRIAVVARLTPEKGVDQAIAALPDILREAPQAELHVIGDGSERAALAGQARALGVDHAVFFHGQQADVRPLLGGCDLLLMPSRWEGFGFVLVEAMLLGLPTVAFDVGAAREIVIDGGTGRLVPPSDLHALAGAVASLIVQPALARRMGESGRLRALTNFTLDRALDDLEAVLREDGPAPEAP